jgi:hypothetical protein
LHGRGQTRRPGFNTGVNRDTEGKIVEREWAKSAGMNMSLVLRLKG